MNVMMILCYHWQRLKIIFSIFSTNIQSIRVTFDEFKLCIEILEQNMFEFSAICIQETWLSENNDTSCFKLEGYNLIPQGKYCSQKGGLLIYLQDKFEYDYKYKLNTYSTWEGQIIRVKKGDRLNKTVNIANIYKKHNDINECYKELIDELMPLLGSLKSNNNEAILAGNFNIDLLKLNNKMFLGKFFDMLTSKRFYPKITLPLKLSNNSATLIDNFLYKLTESTIETTTGILTKKVSDHQPYFIKLKYIQHKEHKPK